MLVTLIIGLFLLMTVLMRRARRNVGIWRGGEPRGSTCACTTGAGHSVKNKVIVCLGLVGGFGNSQTAYFRLRNSIVPSGVVSWYVKSASKSCSALFLSVVPSTVHSPVCCDSKCKYLWVVFRFL
jgi:hypothetical protein